MSASVGVATKFFTCSLGVMYRGHDDLGRLQGGPIESESVRGMFASHLGPRSRRSLAEKGAADFSLTFPSLEAGRGDVRLRVNLHRQRGLCLWLPEK